MSHCILNENTRYFGGACRGGCVRELIEPCFARDFGVVQMPCPEQRAWGGVTKRMLLTAYGAQGTLLYRFRRILLPLFLLYTRLIYRRLARETAHQIEDYLVSGFSVIAVVGIDGSPSCGVMQTLDFRRSFDLTASIDVESFTVGKMNIIIRQSLMDGQGLFTAALQDELKNKRVAIPYLAHDLIAELDGKTSSMTTLFPA